MSPRASAADRNLEQIIKSADKAIMYGSRDPETALMHARKSVDAICRDIYQRELQTEPQNLYLSEMIRALSAKRVFPKEVFSCLKVIQSFGGSNAHEDVDEHVESAFSFFSRIISWYYEDYRKTNIPDQLVFREKSQGFAGFPVTGAVVERLDALADEVTVVRRNPNASFKDAGIDPQLHYKISAKHNGKCLDVIGESTANFVPVVQHDCHDGDNQKWQLIPDGEGFYCIVARHSGKCLDVAGSSQENFVAVIQYDCHRGDSQKWGLVPDGNGYFTVVNKHSDRCLHVLAARQQENLIPVIQYDLEDNDHQKWQFVVTAA